VFAALRKRNAALCLAESEEIQTHWSRPQLFLCTPTEGQYSAKNLQDQMQRVSDLCRQGEVFAYFKHEEGPEGASRAEAMLAAMSAS